MPRARIMVGASIGALAIGLLLSCGKKGPPRPPPRLIPAPIADLRVRQTADRLVLEMTYPAVTTSGLALPAVEALEVLTLRPRPAGGAVPRIDPQMFAVTAQVTRRLEGADLVAATRGAELVIELDAAPGAPMGPLSEAELAAAAAASAASAEAATAARVADAASAATPSPTATPTPAAAAQVPADAGAPADGATPTPTAAMPTATPPPAGPPPILLAVRSFGPRRNESPISNIVTIVPRVAPVAPATLAVEPVAVGVRIAWTVSGAAPAQGGYDVLRRKRGESAFAARVAQVGADRLDHVDTTAVYGDHYEYTVRSVAARDPLVESGDGPVRDLEYKDTFAPPTPTGLVALAEEGRVRLVWDRVAAPDLAGYRLYRQEDGGAEAELPRDPGAGTDHIDDGVRAGVAYSYRVTAVDREDNESAKSEPATATPR